MTVFTLKLIALITMMIDHCAAVFWQVNLFGFQEHISLYLWLRGIGRIAFPIYAFLLANGYQHTRDVAVYRKRLLLCGLLAQIPFVLCFYFGRFPAEGWLVFLRHGNVFFTLAAGLSAADLVRKMQAGFHRRTLVQGALLLLLLILCDTEIIMVDYGALGILLLCALCLTENKQTRVLLLLLWAALQYIPGGQWRFAPVLVGVLLPLAYNGHEGKKNLPFFYLAYPIHLAILSLFILWIYVGGSY